MRGSGSTTWLRTIVVQLSLAAIVVASFPDVYAHAVTGGEQERGQVRAWPCRIVVEPPLLGVLEDGWRRSFTLREQCAALAEARAVVTLEWGRMDSQSLALTQIRHEKDGVVDARVAIPPVRDAVELVAHELQHVLEVVRGLDFAQASKKSGSGVWRVFGGFETQGAIDAGRRVREELARSRHALREALARRHDEH